MAPATCNCYEFIAPCNSTVEYINCKGNLQTEPIIAGNLYRICSQNLPTTGCLTGVVTNIGECIDGECPYPNCEESIIVKFKFANGELLENLTFIALRNGDLNGKPKYEYYDGEDNYVLVFWDNTTNCWKTQIGICCYIFVVNEYENCQNTQYPPTNGWTLVSGTEIIDLTVGCLQPITTTTTTLQPPVPPIPIQPKNECDPLTIFPLGVECFSIEPTYSDSFDGVVGLGITGGTPPYTILWDTGSVAPAIFNVGVGEYKATVTDYYKDFTATTTCILTAITTTTTTTILPVTTTQKTYNDFCLISTVRDGDVIQERNVDLIYNGFYNGYPSWTSVTDNLFVYWSADTTNLWIINGIPNISAINNTYNEPTIGEPLPFNNWQVLGTFSPKIQIDVRIVPGPCSNVNEPTISVIKNDPTCECNGSISVQVNGGTPPYQYSIDGGLSYQSNPVFQNLCSGGYSTFVKDSNDFVDSQFITLVGTTITPITLTLQYTGPNSFEIITSPALSPGTSISFILTHSNSFTKQPASSTQIYNNVVTLLKNSIVIPPSVGPVITTTNLPVVGPCSVFGKLKTDTTTTWQNITITAGDIITGTFTDSVSTLIPIPQCYSEPLKSRSLALTLGNVDDCLQQYITVINPPQDFGLQITGPFIP